MSPRNKLCHIAEVLTGAPQVVPAPSPEPPAPAPQPPPKQVAPAPNPTPRTPLEKFMDAAERRFGVRFEDSHRDPLQELLDNWSSDGVLLAVGLLVEVLAPEQMPRAAQLFIDHRHAALECVLDEI